MEKINILLILKWLPYPLSDGGRQAIYNGILAMKNIANIHITYYEVREDQSSICAREQFSKNCEGVYLHPFFRRKKRIPAISSYNILKALFSRIKYKFFTKDIDRIIDDLVVVNHYPTDFLDHINCLIAKYSIQVIQTEMMDVLPVILSLPDKPKKIFVHHELAYVRNNLAFKDLDLNLSQQIVCETAKVLEIGLINRYDAVITLSSTDAVKLRHAGVHIPIYTSFAIVSSISKEQMEFVYQPVLSFVGPDSHTPNLIGINWFLENCWELLLSKDSSYKLRIIGKWSTATQKGIMERYKSVEFLGFVDDLSQAIEKTTMIVPITVGSGIRMKIQEAALNGVPFVSTTVGAEGLPFQDGINCYIEDDPIKFVEKILALKNDVLRNKFIYAANDLIKSKYSLNALRENRIHIIEEVIGIVNERKE